MLDDVLDDIGGRVIDAAGFLDLRLLFHLRLMPSREPDDLSEELLIDLSENFRGEHGKLIGALGIIEPAKNVFQYLVVDLQPRREIIGRFQPVLFGVKVKEAGVISVVGLFVEIAKPTIDVLAVEERLQLGVGFDATVFANARKISRSMVRWTEKFSSWTDSLDCVTLCSWRAIRARFQSLSGNSASTVAVPRLRSVTAYLSKEPLSTASFVKIAAISSHLAR